MTIALPFPAPLPAPARFDPAAWQALQRLPANLLGRDFIVPDAHGCLSKLRKRLARVKFNPKRDRLFLLGDLADRGPQSLEMLKLLMEPWVFAIMGNHEAMLLSWFGLREFSTHGPKLLLDHGGLWVLRLSREERALFLGPLGAKLLSLPLVLQVDHPSCPFQMVHSELVTLQGPARVMKDSDLTEESVRANETSLLWARRLVGEAEMSCEKMDARGLHFETHKVMLSGAPVEPGLSLTYAGHSIVDRMMLHRSHVFMDRGAFMDQPGTELSILEHGRFAQALADLDAV